MSALQESIAAFHAFPPFHFLEVQLRELRNREIVIRTEFSNTSEAIDRLIEIPALKCEQTAVMLGIFVARPRFRPALE